MFLGRPICRPSVCCPSVNRYFAWRDISELIGEISMKLGTNIHHVSGHCCKFSRSCGPSSRSYVYKSVTATSAEAYTSTAWR